MTNYKLDLDIDNNDYYYRITKNKRNHLVQQKCDRPSYTKNDVMLLNDNISYSTTSDLMCDNLDYAVDNDYREYLMNIVDSKISELNDRLKKIVTLRIYYNKSIREISKIFNISISRTNELYNRSIRYLKIMCNSELNKHNS
jgi:DNA-directed RNA polymerase specialized sigma subunit